MVRYFVGDFNSRSIFLLSLGLLLYFSNLSVLLSNQFDEDHLNNKPDEVSYSESGLPIPYDNYINDFAGLISEGDDERLYQMLKQIELQTGIEITIVTIKQISQDFSTIESYATALFNEWGVGNVEKNKGVMILVALEDRQMRIELGGGFGTRYNDVMKKVIDQKFIPHFKEDRYSHGIVQGTEAVIKTFVSYVSWFEYYKWQIIIAIFIIITVFAAIHCFRNGKTGWGWIWLSICGFLIITFLQSLVSRGSSGGFGGGSSFGGGASGSW